MEQDNFPFNVSLYTGKAVRPVYQHSKGREIDQLSRRIW